MKKNCGIRKENKKNNQRQKETIIEGRVETKRKENENRSEKEEEISKQKGDNNKTTKRRAERKGEGK
jgi:hypothetical protein